MHFLASSSFQLVTLAPADIFCKIEALLAYAGSTTVFCLFFIAGFLNKEHKNAFLILLSASLGFGFITAMKYGTTLPQVFLIALFVLVCVYFFFIVTDKIIREKSGARRKEYVFLFGWILFVILFTSSVFFVAVKHILLFLPPLVILFVIISEEFLKKYAKVYLAAALFLTFLSGIVVSYADFKYAGVYRDFAYENVKKYKTATNTVWFVGHWGLQYYMEKLGCRALGYDDNSPAAGDILIRPLLVMEHQFPSKAVQDRTKVLATYTYTMGFPVRTMNARQNFSFYTNVMLLFNPGFLPYYFSTQDLERFVVYRIYE